MSENRQPRGALDVGKHRKPSVSERLRLRLLEWSRHAWPDTTKR